MLSLNEGKYLFNSVPQVGQPVWLIDSAADLCKELVGCDAYTCGEACALENLLADLYAQENLTVLGVEVVVFQVLRHV